MEPVLNPGAQRLEDAGLVAFTPCGHWWVYPEPATAEQMHEVARFNLGITCGFCRAAWHDATHPRACGTVWRVN
jgi:hypothetical protein